MGTHLIGTAAWSVGHSLPGFAQEGSALERYASVFSVVEVNSSFYRRHQRSTWQRWHDAVPEGFRFSVKLIRTATHEKALVGVEDDIALFFEDLAPLGDKLGAVLVQLPPKLAFDPLVARAFFEAVRRQTSVPVYLEPRHVSWAEAEVDDGLLADVEVGRVLADPQKEELAAAAKGARYLRLHGSPKIYYSAYSDEALRHYAGLVTLAPEPVWCIFDNTASGAALRDAMRLREMVGAPR
ncbi:DUF72 domain-containing protein [Devosia aurantiaca]|uniref:DUF72 domain-containing protein n=1 Tax=Devosia aurantiaca TaxID=2714858 RepID=A0A6M1SC15_9HYPH|nr:DUF72 domain-containing protein [Devosia aurantiaca]NGP17307.1 DUF72 domain-containing protein [Devosia aurantiaca]